MKILALELSSSVGSIAWSGEETFSVSFPSDRQHSGAFFEHLRACLERFGNPEHIVVGLGPGSYAGTRIAIATATGLKAACGAQLIGLASLFAMETDANEYVVVGDARRQSFYFAQVRDRQCVAGPLLCTEAEMQKRLAAVSCPILTTQALAMVPDAIVAQPVALLLAQISAQRNDAGAAQPLEPIYLREPHITQPKAVS